MITTRPVYLTENGCGAMAVLNKAHDAALSEDVETKLDEADRVAKETTARYDAEEVFGRVKARIRGNDRS